MKTLLYAMVLLPFLNLSAQELTLSITNPQVNGNQLTYDVSAVNFIDMIAMQYAIIYDAKKLSFIAFENLNLSDLDQGDFNASEAGVIKNVWFQTTLTGATVDDGTVIYQIVFEMLDATTGDVCFSEDPLLSEFVNITEELLSFTVVDDCHSEPYQILLTTSVNDITDHFGLKCRNPARTQMIIFSLEEAQALTFTIFDLSGTQLVTFPRTEYQPGENSLNVGTTLIPGVYVLSTQIQGQRVALMIVYQ